MQETIKLNPGLAVIRLSESGAGAIRPMVAPESRAFCTLTFDPSIENETLTRPGQCVVAKCDRPSFVELQVEGRYGGAEQPRGSVTIEYLTKNTGKRSTRQQFASPRTSRTLGLNEGDLNDFALVGHVAYQGDQVVGSGEWLCGPDHPNRIEGLTLQWPSCPPGLDIRCRTAESPADSRLGEFLGTKGQSQGISGLKVWLNEGAPKNLSLVAKAQFVQRGLVEMSGQQVDLAGLSARDELIGLNLGLRLSQPQAESDTGVPFRSDRIRVFRK